MQRKALDNVTYKQDLSDYCVNYLKCDHVLIQFNIYFTIIVLDWLT